MVCEVHLLGYSGRLNGLSANIQLLRRLRGERCFASINALVNQIRRDVRRTRILFARKAI